MISVIMPAAGASRRMGLPERKPWLELGGEPLLMRTCRALRGLPEVEEIILVLHAQDLERARRECWDDLHAAGVSLAVAGGASRAESVWRGVEVMSATAEMVAVHDAVRPFVEPEVWERLCRVARGVGAAVPVVPLADTVKRVEADRVLETPRRLGLVRVQTPQVFKSDLFIDANEYCLATGGFSEALTDDASVVETFGREVGVVLGSEYTFKITTPRDLRMANALLRAGLV